MAALMSYSSTIPYQLLETPTRSHFGHLWSAPGIEPNGVVGQGVWDGARHYQFSDYIFYNGQPSAGDTFTLNGTMVTYVASGATGNQINIGGSLATTLRNTNTFLNASADAQISKCTYATNTTNRINIFFKDVSGDGNTYTVATSGTNLSVYWGNLIAPKVGGLDGFQYTALKGSTGVDPQGNLNPNCLAAIWCDLLSKYSDHQQSYFWVQQYDRHGNWQRKQHRDRFHGQHHFQLRDVAGSPLLRWRTLQWA